MKQKGGRNGYYPDFKNSPCGGTLMYDGYTNHLTPTEWNTIQAMKTLDNVANMNGGRLRNPKTDKWVKMDSTEGLKLCRKYISLVNKENI